MYIPSAFQFSEQEAIAFVRENSFGMLVSEGLHVSHIPMLLKETDEGLKLCGHIANNNPQIADINSGAKAKAIFAGPHAYISPLWYSEPLRNVPTWNFQAVEISGTLTRVPEEGANASLRAQVEQYETKWSIDDLSEKYVAGNLRAISFFELCIDDIIGKNKMSQNKSQTERGLIADALTAQDQNDIAHLIRNQ
ncbi:MAG: transcriptional regulator [Robiginitomaculum sp.]|nr:MAG: transcriptional regulator [Robiginitomaculum sp.]